MDEPWKTDRWFTSPWNFLPEIRDGLSLPDAVQVHDVTLRDGEQQAGVVFTTDDKLQDRRGAGRGRRPPDRGGAARRVARR